MGEVMEFITIKGEEFVVIGKKEYEELVERDDWLMCLEAAGVDNWEVYDVARQMQRGELDEEDCE